MRFARIRKSHPEQLAPPERILAPRLDGLGLDVWFYASVECDAAAAAAAGSGFEFDDLSSNF